MAERVDDGGCLCGGVRYRVSGAPLWIAHCHCRSCRRHTGTVMTSYVGYAKAAFRVVAGRPRALESSPGVSRRFCADCGTPLSYESARVADETHVYLATLDRAADFVPSYHVFTAEAVPWLGIDDGLPRHPGLSRGAAPEPAAAASAPAGDALAGGCLCGAVRYRLAEPPANVHLCHCRLCQKSTGSPFAGFGVVPAAALAFTRGAPRPYRSSARATRGFCADCGSPLTFRYDGAERVGVTVGSLDRPDRVRPECHIGIESRLPWLRFADGLPERATAKGACGCGAAG